MAIFDVGRGSAIIPHFLLWSTIRYLRHYRFHIIPRQRSWKHNEQFSASLSRKVLLYYVWITLEETLQTMFWELKSRYCIGLTVRQSSSVLWIVQQLWCCGAAVSACAVQLERNQTKYSGTNKTQQNKCRCLSSGVKLLMHLQASNFEFLRKWL